MSSYLEIGDPIEKPVGEKDVVEFECSDYLGPNETIKTATSAPQPGITSLVVGAAQIQGTKVLVPYEVVDRVARTARILMTAQSSNPNRVAAQRAIVIHIL